MLNEKLLEEESRNVLKRGVKMQTRASEILTKDSELAIAMRLSAKESETTIQLSSKGKVGENLWSNMEASAQKRQAGEKERRSISKDQENPIESAKETEKAKQQSSEAPAVVTPSQLGLSPVSQLKAKPILFND